ncbi:ly6/PLAUR domain-containing protein 2-like [Pelobates fuscus]|uniref:ly6/PLAUR domain-containing protein 2-like n=1 Tax=Pelobates fuscus TaxID=191477 RepID=UPI002FE4DE23
MDTIKIIVVLTTLCIGTAMSLQCYTCTGQTSNANCITTTTNCTTGQTYCMTTSASAGVGKILNTYLYRKACTPFQILPFCGISFASITKTCAAGCTAVSAGSSSLVSGSVSCCNTDLCNTSGATSIKSGVTILAVTAGLILALLKNSL